MCGIFCSVCPLACAEKSDALERCRGYLQSRGPDHFSSLTREIGGYWELTLAASVLWTQGPTLCEQPFQRSGSILCWNGDVFDGSVADMTTEKGCSDTETVSQLLSDLSQNGELLPTALLQIHGPYSIIYLNQKDGSLWFGRDPAGRHSLLWGFTQDPQTLTISSVAPSSLPQMKEVPACGVFQVRMLDLKGSEGLNVILHPWNQIDDIDVQSLFGNIPVRLTISSPISNDHLFSPRSASLSGPQPLEWPSNISSLPNAADIMEKLLGFENFRTNSRALHSLLEAAVRVRVSKMQRICQLCVPSNLKLRTLSTSCFHSKVAVLFSGGLDSAILASLASRFVPENEPIDLLNVAFEKSQGTSDLRNNKERHKGDNQNVSNQNLSPKIGSSMYNVPDRVTGKQTLEELQRLHPTRKWNFVEIDVPLSELKEQRSVHISHVIHPLRTVLDDSLGCALWFAARGRGNLNGTTDSYTSPARIVLLGMGADEQLGGYMRHRTAFQSGGWSALQAALDEDVRRIPLRNLGRDDRVTSDHGRQPRLPYLDESVMNFVKSLPAWERCCPNNQLPRGIGDKLLLRLVGWSMGLHRASLLPKRAMQFGSRIANSRDNAAHVSQNL